MNITNYFKDGLRYNLIFNDEDNSIDVIAEFIKWAINNNKKCIYYTDRICFDELDFFLKKNQVELSDIIMKNKLTIDSAKDFFVNNRTYIRYVNIIKKAEESISEGYSGLAVIADRDCFLDSEFSKETLYEYEKAIGKILSKYQIAAISTYNIDKFGVDTFLEIAHLNSNFIYKRDNQIFVYNNKENILSSAEQTCFINYFLKEWQRIKRENKMYKFIAGLSTELSYKNDEKELLEAALINICKSINMYCGIGALFTDGMIDCKKRVFFNISKDMQDVYLNLIHESSLKTNDSLYKVNYMAFDTNSLPNEIQTKLKKHSITFSTVIPLKKDDRYYGFFWLATRNRYISYEHFCSDTELIFKVCDYLANIIEEYRKYKVMQENLIGLREMKALGELASGIGHEFNNILIPILGYTQMLKARTDDKTSIKYISMIEDGARDGARIVKRIHDFSKNAKKEMELVYIDKIIEQSVEITKHKWNSAPGEKGEINLNLNLEAKTFINGIATEVREIFINIINNAVDAMPEGGIININSYTEDGYVFVRIDDTGKGMDEGVKSRIFEPFYTTKDEKGNGLGLSIVHSFVVAMKGEIKVNSKIGQGSSFVLKFPSILEKPVVSGNAPFIKSQKSYKIFVIDDNLKVSETVADMLLSAGHDVSFCTDRDDVVKIFNKKDFDCIICDLGMVKYSGVELSKILKAQKPSVYFILMTGCTEKLNSLELSCIDAVIQKPFSIEEICKLLNDTIED